MLPVINFGKDIEYDEIFVVNKDPEDISYENDFFGENILITMQCQESHLRVQYQTG